MSAAPTFRFVVPAAGAGRRMAADTPKQYLQIGDRTVIEHTLDGLLSCTRCHSVTVAVAADDTCWPDIGQRYADRRVVAVHGGDERSQSVLNALDSLAPSTQDTDWVLVHDAARPCLRTEDLDALIGTLVDDAVGGLLGVPVADTMKQVDTNGRVTQTVSREDLWHALTPQMFRFGLLRSALSEALSAGQTVTDEASAMELAGHHPRMVQGHRDNIKITLPADLSLAAFYLQTGASS